jgi:3-oxoadipate enol-lactonase
VLELGDPRAPTLVLLHGAGLAHRMWQPQMVAFAEHYHVLAPDLPGFGDAIAEGPFTFARAVARIADLVAGAGAGERVHVCGLSLGAMVALQFALDAPSRVASLVVCAGQLRPFRRLMDLQMALLRALPESAVASGTGVPRQLPELAAAARQDMNALGKAGVLGVMREAARFDVRERVAEINVPALVLCGAKDRANLPAARRIAAGLPRGELRVLPAAGHLCNLDQPVLFATTVLEFLDRGGWPR